jgi:hypothetical protein
MVRCKVFKLGFERFRNVQNRVPVEAIIFGTRNPRAVRSEALAPLLEKARLLREVSLNHSMHNIILCGL